MPEQLAPPAAPFGRIVRRFTAADGSPASGAVVFTPRSPAADGGTAIVDASIVAELDADGWMRQDLTASDSGGAFRTYLVALRGVWYGFDQETAPPFDIVVTAGQEDDLGSLSPVAPSAGTTPVVDESAARRAEEAAARAVAAADRAEAAQGGTGPMTGLTLETVRAELLTPHVLDDEPHPAYDDMPSLSVTYRNRKALA